jgi:hypothetical protein
VPDPPRLGNYTSAWHRRPRRGRRADRAGPEVAVRVLKSCWCCSGVGALRFLERSSADAPTRSCGSTVALFLFNLFAVVGANQLAIQLPMTVLRGCSSR